MALENRTRSNQKAPSKGPWRFSCLPGDDVSRDQPTWKTFDTIHNRQLRSLANRLFSHLSITNRFWKSSLCFNAIGSQWQVDCLDIDSIPVGIVSPIGRRCGTCIVTVKIGTAQLKNSSQQERQPALIQPDLYQHLWLQNWTRPTI